MMKLRVLEAKHFWIQQSGITSRVMKDYEIDFELEDGRVYIYNGEKHVLKRGDILFRTPGGVVKATVKQNTYILTLDFSARTSLENYSRNLPGPTQMLCDDPLLVQLEPILHPEYPEQIMMIYDKLLQLPNVDSPAGRELVMELLYRLNAEVCRKNYEHFKPEKNVCHIVMDYMQKNLQKEITLEELAKLVHLNKCYLGRLFRKTYGKPPIDMLIDLRMTKALDLISNTDIKVCEIAAMCGYNTQSFFIKEYKKKYGYTPDMHRKVLRDVVIHKS